MKNFKIKIRVTTGVAFMQKQFEITAEIPALPVVAAFFAAGLISQQEDPFGQDFWAPNAVALAERFLKEIA